MSFNEQLKNSNQEKNTTRKTQSAGKTLEDTGPGLGITTGLGETQVDNRTNTDRRHALDLDRQVICWANIQQN